MGQIPGFIFMYQPICVESTYEIFYTNYFLSIQNGNPTTVMASSMILEPLMETLKGLFADKLVEDDREPIAMFELPFVEQTQGFMWALYPPNALWHQLAMEGLLLVVCCWLFRY
jgi:hypothetical protein